MSFDFFLLLYFVFSENEETEKLNFWKKMKIGKFLDELHKKIKIFHIYHLDLIRFFLIMATKKDYDHLFKLVLIGDYSVGKSCLLLRFAVRLDGTRSLAAEK